MKIFIYKITSPNGRIYIGKSKNIKNRWADYKRLHCKNQKKLYNSFIKYGVDSHIFEVIDEVTIEGSNTSERHYISLYDSCKNGLNCTNGGEGNIIFFEETINKLKKFTPWIKGKTHTDEVKKKLSEINKGNSYHKGKFHTEETKKKIGNLQRGKKQSEETKQKRSESMKGKTLGRKHSEETKKLISNKGKGKIAHNRKKVIAINYITGDIVGTYSSYAECAKELNITNHIYEVISGKRKQASGYTFKLH